MNLKPHHQRGRGTATNPPNRFDNQSYTPFEEDIEELGPLPRTQFIKDTSRSVLSWNDSPDLPYDAGLNPYRGCEHGCAYCYARPYHEFLGYSSGLDFETKILVKEDAPELLRREFESTKWVPQVIGMSGVTDPYQPIERKLLLTRRCLQVLAEFRNPVTIVTKNHLVTRDIDILTRLARCKAVMVNLSVTTLDPQLGRSLEPRTSSPVKRLEAIHQLAQAGVPVGVMVAPVIPGLTDHEIPQIVKAAAEAGARTAWHCVVRLPQAVRDLFTTWLETYTPLRKEKVLNRLKEIRGDSLDDSRFHIRMEGEGEWAEQIRQVFDLSCKKANLAARRCGLELSVSAFKRPGPSQEKLF
jgi:DNA repair photolyase